jgi:hypothetical protein
MTVCALMGTITRHRWSAGPPIRRRRQGRMEPAESGVPPRVPVANLVPGGTLTATRHLIASLCRQALRTRFAP